MSKLFESYQINKLDYLQIYIILCFYNHYFIKLVGFFLQYFSIIIQDNRCIGYFVI